MHGMEGSSGGGADGKQEQVNGPHNRSGGAGSGCLGLSASYPQHSCGGKIPLKCTFSLTRLPGEEAGAPHGGYSAAGKDLGKTSHVSEFLPLPLPAEQLWANNSMLWSLISGPQDCRKD